MANGATITLYNNVLYAEEHETGKATKKATIKQPYVQGGVKGVVTGGNITARPFMKPSNKLLRSPQRLVENKLKELGW